MADFGKYSVSGSGNSITFRPLTKDVSGGVITFGLGNAVITLNTLHMPTNELVIPLTGESDNSKILGKKSPYDFKRWHCVSNNVANVTTKICGTPMTAGETPMCKDITYPEGDFNFYEFSGGEIVENNWMSKRFCHNMYRVARGALGIAVDDLVVLDTDIIVVSSGGGIAVFRYNVAYGFMPLNEYTLSISSKLETLIPNSDTRQIKEISGDYTTLLIRCGNGVCVTFNLSDKLFVSGVVRYDVCSILGGVVTKFEQTYAKDKASGKIVPYVPTVKEKIYVHDGNLMQNSGDKTVADTVITSGVDGGGTMPNWSNSKVDECYTPTERGSEEHNVVLDRNKEECKWNWVGKGNVGYVVAMNPRCSTHRLNW